MGNYLTSFNISKLSAYDIMIATDAAKNQDTKTMFEMAMKCSSFDLKNAPASEWKDILYQFCIAMMMFFSNSQNAPDIDTSDADRLLDQWRKSQE